MAVKPIPEGYHAITPYFVVADASKFIEFLKSSFGATVTEMHQGPDGRVGHAEVRIGDSMLMMADASEKYPPRTQTIYLYMPDTDAAYNAALAAGGTSTMEPANQFYGDRNAGVKDPWGNEWWIATHVEDVSPEEMERRSREKFAAGGQ